MGEGSDQEWLVVGLWIAMIVVVLGLTALVKWAKHLNRWSRVQFWEVQRIRGRYASGALNAIAVMFGSTRDYFMVLCDLLVERAPVEA